MPTVTAGQTASGIVKSLGTTPEAFLKANPSFAAKGGSNDWMGLSGLIQPGQSYVVPGTEASATQTTVPRPGSGTYPEDLAKSFDQNNKAYPNGTIDSKGNLIPNNSAVGTSDAARQQAMDGIRADLGGGLAAPAPFNSVETYNKLRTEQGVVQDENEMNAIQSQKAQLQQEISKFRSTAFEGVPEAGGTGMVSEAERNVNFRLDQLNLQEQAVTSRLNTKNSYISTMIGLGQQDYQAAKAGYDDAYNRNLKAVDLYNTRMSDDKKDAMTGFTTITNLLKDNNVDPSAVSPALKAQIDSLTLKAGLPAGIFETLAASHPDAKILAPIEVPNASGGKDVYFFTQDQKTGQPTLLKTVGLSGSGQGTPASGASSKKYTSGSLEITNSQIGELSSALEAHRGKDGYTDTAVYKRALGNWTAAGGLEKDFYAKFPPKQYLNPNDPTVPSQLKGMLPKASTQGNSYFKP